MRIEDQVTSLELSKRLKELGVKQESYFYWDHTPMLVIGPWVKQDETCSAFSVSELGEILPADVQNRICKQIDGKWVALKMPDAILVVNERTQADAYAEMLIYLLENKLSKI